MEEKKVIEVETLKTVLKEIYLEVCDYDLSGMTSVSDIVACTSSKFRQTLLDKLGI